MDVSTPVDLLATMITPQNPAVLVRDFKTEKTFIITRSDLHPGVLTNLVIWSFGHLVIVGSFDRLSIEQHDDQLTR